MIQPNNKKPCPRCLLIKTGEADLEKLIDENIALIPDEKRTESEVYRKRLDICRDCDNLISGTCTKCGCYVRIRAAKSHMHCPDISQRW